jgi:uncharacterized protein (TIGR02246 family)
MRRVLIAVSSILIAGNLLASKAEEAAVHKMADDFAVAWNRHDVKAMAGFWAPDGDVINPFGRWAKGRAEIEKLFQDEHSTMMKKTTFKHTGTSVRFVEPELAFADFDIEITGILNPDGKTAPLFKAHSGELLRKSAGKWWVVAARVATYPPPPPKK